MTEKDREALECVERFGAKIGRGELTLSLIEAAKLWSSLCTVIRLAKSAPVAEPGWSEEAVERARYAVEMMLREHMAKVSATGQGDNIQTWTNKVVKATIAALTAAASKGGE